MGPNERYEAVIGLEVHAQLLTQTKAFCGCSTEFGTTPNTNICPVCLGLPGALPVLNIRVVEFALRMGIALNCTVAPRSVFARKNYFYPDLPKGYQISQYEAPICVNGSVEIDLEGGERKRIGVTRIHMEEDAGKSIHDLGADTLVDVNRCGVPLLEIVSEPDLRTPREAYHYLSRIRQIVMYLGICDGNMEEGSLRCDANVSVRPAGTDRLGTKTEIKNMNSLRHVERALEFEQGRQIRLLEDGGAVAQETLLWDAGRNIVVPMRTKEQAHDYRYFPDPDLVPVLVDPDWIGRIRQQLPELPASRRDRIMMTWGLPRYDADLLTAEKDVADYFEKTVAALGGAASRGRENAKAASNWVMTDVLRVMAEKRIRAAGFPVTPENLATMIGLMNDGTISGKIAKDLFAEMAETGEAPRTIIDRHGWVQVSDPGPIEEAIDQVLAANRVQTAKYIAGNEKLFGFFVGETMKRTEGKANPKLVNEILRRKLDALKH